MNAAQRCLSAAHAVALRKRNSTTSMQHRLPDELWLLVWAQAHLADRITLTHVCHFWRALALRSPRMWTHVEVYSLEHRLGCDCNRCTFQEEEKFVPSSPVDENGSGSSSGSDEEGDDDGASDSDEDANADIGRHDPGWTNIRTLRHVLKRNGSLPFSLEFTCDMAEASIWVAMRILNALASHGHASRLRELNITYVNPLIVRCVLSALKVSVPVLEILSCTRIHANSAAAQSFAIPIQIDMPALRVLEFSPELAWTDNRTGSDPGAQLPTLRRLELTVIPGPWTAWRSLRSMLELCPTLEELHLHVDPVDNDSNFNVSPSHGIDDACRGIRNLTIDGVGSVCESTILRLFAHSASQRAALSLRYSTFTTLGFGILGDLPKDEPKELLVVHAAGVFSIEAKTVGPTGSQTRALSCPVPAHDGSLWPRVWKHLSSSSIVKLDVDVSLFTALIRTMPEGAAVTELSLFLDVGNDLPFLSTATRSVFTVLRTLRLCGPPRVAARPLNSAALAAFVDNLRLPQELDSLVLEHIALTATGAKGAGLARSVLFRATPIPVSLRRRASWEPKRE